MKSIRSRLWFGITALVLIIIMLIWIFQVVLLNRFYIHERKVTLLNEADRIAALIQESNNYNTVSTDIENEIRSFSTSISAMVFIFGNNNAVLLDNIPGKRNTNNERPPRHPDNDSPKRNPLNLVSALLQDKEISTKITEGKPFVVERRGHWFPGPGSSIIVVKPIFKGKELVGNIIISSPLVPINETISILKKQLSIITVVSLCIATLLALLLAKYFTKPIISITEVSKQIAKGNFNARVAFKSNDEIGVLGETVNDMAKQLNRIEQLRKEFIANVSHELKTPISLIKAYSELLSEMDNVDLHERRQYLQVITDESDRLNSMIEDILYLSKMEAGYANLTFNVFALNDLLNNVIERLSYFSSNKKINIIMESYREDVSVYGDKDKLYQVFYNIVNNAINYSYENGEILIKVFPVHDVIRVEIIDHGKGIPEEDLPYIWERFYKVDKSGQRDDSGTGLGMAIAKNILEAHNFNFGVESELNKGTTIWIEMNQRDAQPLAG